MQNFNNLQKTLVIAALCLGAVTGLHAKGRKGDKFLKEGQAAEARKQYDQAIELYDRALNADPTDAAYRIASQRVRFQASQMHVDLGQKVREQGNLEGAIEHFQKAFAADPSSAIALQELRRTTAMLEEEKRKGTGAKSPDRGLTPVQQARKDSDEKMASLQPPPELKPITRQIDSLKMNNQSPKVLYETVGKLAGVNVIFDSLFTSQGKNYNLDLTNSTLEEALDYIALLTHTFWKPVSANSIFVAEENPQKRRDYEDMVVKVFYIQNATSVQEFQEIATAVRSVTDIRRVYTYNPQNAILVRDTPDKVALAEVLIRDLDKAKSEVVVDVIVMEANRSKTRSLAAAIAGATGGLNQAIGFTPRNPVLSGATPAPPAPATPGGIPPVTGGTNTPLSNLISLAQVGRITTNDFSTSLPGALVQALLSDATTRVLQRPQLRASDGMKSTLKIGEKYPYATGSFGSSIGSVGVGVSPLVSTQFQFYDVGVNVDITPRVHGPDEVTLKVSVEISAITGKLDLGGVSQPIIGIRKNEAEIRLREGEVSLIGGLTQSQDTRTIAGIPGLVNIPILGRFFGTESVDKNRGELLIALIPHVVRRPDLTDSNLKGLAAGSELTVKLNYAPRKEGAKPTGPGALPTPPAATGPGPATTAPAATTPAAPAETPSTTPATAPRLTFLPASAQASLSGAVTVSLVLDNATDLFTAPLKIKFDPKILRLNDIVTGPLLSSDGQKLIEPKDIRNDAGEASLGLSRFPGAGGVNGSGVLVTLTFQAVGKGATKITLLELGLKNSQLQPINVTLPEINITIQ